MINYRQILLVDDDVDDISFLEQTIRRIDPSTECRYAKNGIEGLQSLAIEKPDLIISDINMPIMDGILFLQEVRTVLKLSVPFIMTSTSPWEQYLAISPGANYFLPKSNSLSELYTQLHNLLLRDFSGLTT